MTIYSTTSFWHIYMRAENWWREDDEESGGEVIRSRKKCKLLEGISF